MENEKGNKDTKTSVLIPSSSFPREPYFVSVGFYD